MLTVPHNLPQIASYLTPEDFFRFNETCKGVKKELNIKVADFFPNKLALTKRYPVLVKWAREIHTIRLEKKLKGWKFRIAAQDHYEREWNRSSHSVPYLLVCATIYGSFLSLINRSLDSVVKSRFEQCIAGWDDKGIGHERLMPLRPSIWGSRSILDDAEPFMVGRLNAYSYIAGLERELMAQCSVDSQEEWADRAWRELNCQSLDRPPRCQELDMQYAPKRPETHAKVIMQYLFPIWSQEATVCNRREHRVCREKFLAAIKDVQFSQLPAWWLAKMQAWNTTDARIEEVKWLRSAPIKTLKECDCEEPTYGHRLRFKVTSVALIVIGIISSMRIRALRLPVYRVEVSLFAAIMAIFEFAELSGSLLHRRWRRLG